MNLPQLQSAIQQIPRDAGKDSYQHHMWEYALQDQHFYNEQTNSIPYLPFVPEKFGLNLTHESRVLDIGCLEGYGLFDFTRSRLQRNLPIPEMVGIDVPLRPLQIAQELADIWASGQKIMYAQAIGEKLPFAKASFDLLILRLVLPYVELKSTLNEVNRVLQPGGIAFFQLHSFRYYLKRCQERPFNPRRLSYLVRPIISGLVFRLFQRQPRNRWFRQTALDTATLTRLLSASGFTPIWHGPFREKPQIAFKKS